LFELASKDGIEQNLGRITEGDDSLGFELGLKKKQDERYLLYNSHSLLNP
jgi:hypothetical protein